MKVTGSSTTAHGREDLDDKYVHPQPCRLAVRKHLQYYMLVLPSRYRLPDKNIFWGFREVNEFSLSKN